MMATNLTINLSSGFLQDVTGTKTGAAAPGTEKGSWVYLYQPTPATGSGNWTVLVDDGAITSTVNAPDTTHSEYWANVPLNVAGQQINGGAIYLIVQSEDPDTHTDLTTVPGWSETSILPNVQTYNYGFTAFEYALLGQAGDQGDITYIPGYGPHIAVAINGNTRGMKLDSESFIEQLKSPAGATFTYPTSGTGTPFSQLDGKPSIIISPSNSTFGDDYYGSKDWSDYLNQTINKLTDMTFSGTTGGAPDAAGLWHNGQYYSYSVQAVTRSGTNYYLFSPDANSQTQGYMLISQDAVAQNLYAPGQGGAGALGTMYESVTVVNGVVTAVGPTYDIPGRTPPGAPTPPAGEFNVSGNNQWGNALTQYFTGFTAGYWGAVANQANPVNQGGGTSVNLAGTVNLDSNINWDPAYAFDQNRSNATPAYQHNDPYSYQFYQLSNAYASAFSDNLANKLNPGPQISLATGPGQNADVSQIDLYVYGSQEVDGLFQQPVGANFVAQPNGGDYVIPTVSSSTLTLQVQGFNLASQVVANAQVQLGIYKGMDNDKHAQFDYVLLPSTNNVYQNFTISGTSGNWTAAAAGANPGFIQINGLPLPTSVTANDVYWYQLVFGDSKGGNQRVFDLYATSSSTTPGQLQLYNPPAGNGSANDPTAAIDGNASVVVNSVNQINVNLLPDASLPSALLTNGFNKSASNTGTGVIISALAAPVAGHLQSGDFSPIAGQNGTGVTVAQGYKPIVNPYVTTATSYFANPAPVATVSDSASVAFGWTGTNNITIPAVIPADPSTLFAPTMPVFETAAPFTQIVVGQVSEYTNKILPGDTAQVTILNGTTTIGVVTGVADLDGQWQTDAITLGNGTYTATMVELTPAGTQLAGSPTSVAVTINVDVAEFPLLANAASGFMQLGGVGQSGSSGNWIRLDPSAAKSTLADGATVLFYATTVTGALIRAEDGHSGAGVTLQEAILGWIGDVQADKGGMDLLRIGQSVFLPGDGQLHFAVLKANGTIDQSPTVTLAAQGNGSVKVNVAGLDLVANTDNDLSDVANIASTQRETGLPLVYLDHGATVGLQLVGHAANVNTVGFVRMDIDATTGALSVGGVAYDATDAFYAAVRSHLDTGFTNTAGGTIFDQSKNWTVAGASGYYAPVMLSQNGDTFVVGTANSDGREHVRLLGENTFGFEDLRANLASDFDYNDMVIGIRSLTDPP